MATIHQNNLGRALVRFFQDYLPNQRGMSAHTIRSYRDAIVLFLGFAAQDVGRGVERLDIEDLLPQRVIQFLTSLEAQRGNGIATRNARLAALHTLARFLATEHPQSMATLQGVLAVPFKRGGRNMPIEYLEQNEVMELLGVIDRSNDRGRRDYALFALMFNTGARVQEILDLRASDVRLDAPAQVRLTGKGNKIRVCPIWATTAQLLRPLCSQRQDSAADTPLFVNQRGQPLTRFGVRYLLQRHLANAATRSPTLKGKSIHPHSIRHYLPNRTMSCDFLTRASMNGDLIFGGANSHSVTRHSPLAIGC